MCNTFCEHDVVSVFFINFLTILLKVFFTSMSMVYRTTSIER